MRMQQVVLTGRQAHRSGKNEAHNFPVLTGRQTSCFPSKANQGIAALWAVHGSNQDYELLCRATTRSVLHRRLN
jgi:hypothetical protein